MEEAAIDRLVKQLDFEGGAYTTISVIGIQLGWNEDQFNDAINAIDIGYQKSKFLGAILEAYSDEELLQVVETLERLQDVVEVAVQCIPNALAEYLEDSGYDAGSLTDVDNIH